MANAMFLPVRRVTTGPKHHFFGYYDKRQWDPTGRYLLAYETDFMDRPQKPDDRAVIGMIDLEDGDTFHRLAQTKAWCWQQGAMLQWLPGSSSRVIYNDRIGDRFVAVILDVFKGTRRVLPRPIYSVSNDGQWGLSLNFSRLNTTRPGYGYKGLHDHWYDDPHPEDDGIYLMDLDTGDHELIVDLASMTRFDPDESMNGATHWFNHLLFSPNDERFVFLHRWSPDGKRRMSRMFTAAKDGTAQHLIPIEVASHFIWRDNTTILVWARTAEHGSHYYMCKDRADDVRPFAAGVLVDDGHCTVSPDGRWICIDSAHEGSRQVYVLDACRIAEF